MRLDLIQEIRGVVGFDAYAWLLTDPETTVGSSPLADVPCLPELPRLIRLKYLTTVNRWTALGAPVAVLSEVTGGDLAQSLVWRELLRRYGVGDVASAVFEDRFGCWGFLDLWRADQRVRFGPDEAEYLSSIAAPVTAALRRSQAETFPPRPPRDSRRFGPVVLLLSADLEVLRQTPDAAALLQALVPPAEGHAPIPAGAYNVAAQLLASEAGIDNHPPWARVHLSEGLWVTLRAARIAKAGSFDPPDVAVTVEEASPGERVSVFGRAFALTPRERELLGHLVTGVDTRQLAARMFLTENTVQDHLKSIFAKTGEHTRRSLISRALGT